MDAWTAHVTVKALNTIVESYKNEHIQAFGLESLKRALRELLLSIMDDEEIIAAFEFAVALMATSPAVVQAICNSFVVEKATIALEARFVASQARKVVSAVARKSIAIVPLSTPPSPYGLSSSDDKWKEEEIQDNIWGKTQRRSHHRLARKTEAPGQTSY